MNNCARWLDMRVGVLFEFIFNRFAHKHVHLYRAS